MFSSHSYDTERLKEKTLPFEIKQDNL